MPPPRRNELVVMAVHADDDDGVLTPLLRVSSAQNHVPGSELTDDSPGQRDVVFARTRGTTLTMIDGRSARPIHAPNAATASIVARTSCRFTSSPSAPSGTD